MTSGRLQISAQLSPEERSEWSAWFGRHPQAHAWQHPIAPLILEPGPRHQVLYFSNELFRGWLTEHRYPLGIKRWSVRRGPVATIQNLPLAISRLVHAARERGISSLNLSPYHSGEDAIECARMIRQAGGTVAAEQGGHTRSTVVDLRPSENEILSSFNTNTRRQLRKAEGLIEIDQCRSAADAEAFFDLYCNMVKAKGADVLQSSYIQRLRDVLGGHSEFGRFLVARHQGTVVAGIIVVRGPKTSWYLHGTSDAKRRDLPLTFACHWQAMRWLKADGAQTYDFGGLGDDPTVAVEGINRFKRGFSKTEVDCTPEFELVLRPLQNVIYRQGRQLERWL